MIGQRLSITSHFWDIKKYLIYFNSILFPESISCCHSWGSNYVSSSLHSLENTYESMSLCNYRNKINVWIVLEHKLSTWRILHLHYKNIEDIQSIYKTRYWNNIWRWPIKAMLEIQFILFLQYNILFPQER